MYAQRVCTKCGVSYIRWGDPFDGIFCQCCHTVHFAKSRRYTCPVCKETKLYYHFIREYQGYRVDHFRLCCQGCKKAFNALPEDKANHIIRQALHHYYKPGQVVYILRESDTHAIRYAGRTNNPPARLRQHRKQTHQTSFSERQQEWERLPVAEKERLAQSNTYSPTGPNYVEGFWLYDLKARGAEPMMEIVEYVHDGPMIAERELLWICHLIKTGCQLVNTCMYDAKFITRVKTARYDFLHDFISTEELAQFNVTLVGGYTEFIRRYYCHRY